MQASSLLMTNHWWFVGLFHPELNGDVAAGNRFLGVSLTVTDSLLCDLLQYESLDLISFLSWSKRRAWCDGSSVVLLSLKIEVKKIR